MVYLTQEIPKETKGSNSFNKAINGIYLHAQNQSTLLHKIMDIKYLKLHWKKLDGLANQVGGTENIFMELFGSQNGNDTFWLDSSSTDMRRARFSFMGGKGGHLWKQITYRLSDDSDQRTNCGGYMTIQDATGCEKKTYLKNGFFEFLNQELKSFLYDNDDYKSLPFDFHGGFVGFIGYNMKIECGALSNNHKTETPDACFFFADNLIVVDHSNDDVYILSVHDAIHSMGLQEQSYNEHWMDETEMKLLNLRNVVATKKLDKKKTHVSTSTIPDAFYIEKTRHQYINDVEKCLQFIHDGESYELCLTTQMKMSVKDVNSLEIYRDLRKRNPAPYAAWLNFSKEKLSLCCSSPERFLQLDGNGILEAKPIKGTIGRGLTLEEDEHLKLQLQHSEKDQAENLMIVDLLRNDLGRVCEPGTVHVPRLMEVESYSTVHTLVSTIRGTKISNASPVDCVRASFPGGSMTGAPKLRSMELLDSLECSARGIYSGSIGFFSYNQTFDFNIVIRTIVIHNEEAAIGAGGAVIALSNPNEEYNEMILKAKAPTNAIVNVQLNQLNSCDKRIVIGK